jgi:hypothetical protein
MARPMGTEVVVSVERTGVLLGVFPTYVGHHDISAATDEREHDAEHTRRGYCRQPGTGRDTDRHSRVGARCGLEVTEVWYEHLLWGERVIFTLDVHFVSPAPVHSPLGVGAQHAALLLVVAGSVFLKRTSRQDGSHQLFRYECRGLGVRVKCGS